MEVATAVRVAGARAGARENRIGTGQLRSSQFPL